EAVALEVGRGVAGGGETEVALVGDVADDGEPPGLLLEAVLSCGGEDEREGVAVDPGVGGVAATDVEAECAGGEGAGLEHELELAAVLLVGRGVADDLLDGRPAAEDAGLLDAGAQDVDGGAGQEDGGDGGQGEEQEQLADHARAGFGSGGLDPRARRRVPGGG